MEEGGDPLCEGLIESKLGEHSKKEVAVKSIKCFRDVNLQAYITPIAFII